MHRLPFTWLYVLRTIQAGLKDAADISGFLGVPEDSVNQWLAQLTLREAIMGENQLELSKLGRELVENSSIEKVVSIPARLTWDCVRGAISETQYDELRIRERRQVDGIELAIKTKIPKSADLSLAECQKFLGTFLDDLSEEFDGAEILDIHFSSKPVKASKNVQVLLYGTSASNFEIKVMVDGSRDNDAAAYVRECPIFRARLPTLFNDTSVIDFFRRADIVHTNGWNKLPFFSSSPPDGTLAGGKFRTRPGQGIAFLEEALLNAKQSVKVVITECQLIEWESFRRLVADTLKREIDCEIIIVFSQTDGNDRYERLPRETRTYLSRSLSSYSKAIRRLKILARRELYRGQWRPLVMADDKRLWCGTEMLAGGAGMLPYFGISIDDKIIAKKITKLISEQISGAEHVTRSDVKVEFKKKRVVKVDHNN